MDFRDVVKEVMRTITFGNYGSETMGRKLNFFPFACPNLVELRDIAKEVMLAITLKFSPFACPNLVEFRDIAKEVMLTIA